MNGSRLQVEHLPLLQSSRTTSIPPLNEREFVQRRRTEFVVMLTAAVTMWFSLFMIFSSSSTNHQLHNHDRNDNTNAVLEQIQHNTQSFHHDSDRVTFVPGFGTPLETQYAGIVHVNDKAVGSLFYWFFEARGIKADNTTPLIIWLNGGPGTSSMIGLMTEMGPYRMTHERTLIPHAYSWTHVGHMLFMDQPVGTGYASVRDENGYVTNQEEMARELFRGIQQFYQHHPEYQINPVYLSGESYAAKYVTYVAHYIHVHNQQATPSNVQLHINLVGVSIGNGFMWPVLQTRSIPDYAIALGLIDSQQYEHANGEISTCEEFHRQGRHVEAFQVCQTVKEEIYHSAGNLSVYDIRKPYTPINEMLVMLTTYFNDEQVRRHLHVPPGRSWMSVDRADYGVGSIAPPVARHLMEDEMLDIPIEIFRDLLDNYKFLFYVGNMDGSACNNLGIGRMMDRLAWSGTTDYRVAVRQPWTVNNQLAGLAKTAGNMSYVVVLNAGHVVPADQPEVALDMIRRFITDQSFNVP